MHMYSTSWVNQYIQYINTEKNGDTTHNTVVTYDIDELYSTTNH
jgi:hypothetical protein